MLFRSISFAIFLMIFALFELYGSYQNPTSIGRMFNMMFYLCVGSFVWPYILWFIPVFWVGMYQFRILNVRTFSATLLGIFTVFWFVLGWSILKHDMVIFIHIAQCFSDIHLVFVDEALFAKLPMYLLLFGLCMIILPVYISLYESENVIRTRHFISFLFMLGLSSFLLSLLYAPVFVNFECVFYLSVSIIASYAFSGKHEIVSYSVYYLVVAALIIFLFIRLWNIL